MKTNDIKAFDLLINLDSTYQIAYLGQLYNVRNMHICGINPKPGKKETGTPL